MNSYEATFSITAEVTVKVAITGENQTEGLVAAHDAIRLAKPDQAVVVSLNLDTARNIDFKRIEQAKPVDNANPPSPLSLETRFKVMLFQRPKCAGIAALETEVPTYETAKGLAESVLQPNNPYASAQVIDQLGFKVLDVQAERGDWEVEAISASDPRSTRRFSWLPTAEDAKQVALQLLSHKETAYVRIIDYTDRKRGPVLWKEIG